MRIFKDDSTREKWYVDYFFRGRRIRYFAGTSKAAAGTLRTRIEMEINQGVHDPAKLRLELKGDAGAGMTLGQLLDSFMRLYRGRRSRGLSGYYGQCVQTYRNYFGENTPLADIGTLQVKEFRVWCERQGFGPSTIRKKLISLGTIFRWALTEDIIQENPADAVRVRRPSDPPNREIFLTQDQVHELLEECEPLLRRFVHFIVETGTRLGEPIKLKRSECDAKTGWIYVQEGKTKARKLPYTDLLQAIVNTGPRHLRSDRVFCDADGQPLNPNKMSKAIKAKLRAIGLPEASAHSLRHTFASRLAARGESLKMIAELLGISEVTAQRYAHLTPSAVQRTMRQLHGEDVADEETTTEPQRIPRGS